MVEVLPAAPERVADLGCGDGRVTALVLDARPDVAEVVAVDTSPPMLEKARERFAADAGCRSSSTICARASPASARSTSSCRASRSITSKTRGKQALVRGGGEPAAARRRVREPRSRRSRRHPSCTPRSAPRSAARRTIPPTSWSMSRRSWVGCATRACSRSTACGGGAGSRCSSARSADRREPGRELLERFEDDVGAGREQRARVVGPGRDADRDGGRADRRFDVGDGVADVDPGACARSRRRASRRRTRARRPRRLRGARSRCTGARAPPTSRSRRSRVRRAPRTASTAARAPGAGACRRRRSGPSSARGSARSCASTSSAGNHCAELPLELRARAGRARGRRRSARPISCASASMLARMPGRESTSVMSRSKPTVSMRRPSCPRAP